MELNWKRLQQPASTGRADWLRNTYRRFESDINALLVIAGVVLFSWGLMFGIAEAAYRVGNMFA